MKDLKNWKIKIFRFFWRGRLKDLKIICVKWWDTALVVNKYGQTLTIQFELKLFTKVSKLFNKDSTFKLKRHGKNT